MRGWMDAWVDAWMDGCVDNRCVDGWMYGCVDEWMNAWMDGWMLLFIECLLQEFILKLHPRTYNSSNGLGAHQSRFSGLVNPETTALTPP